MKTKPTRLEALAEFEAAPDDALFDETVIAHVEGCSVAKKQRDRWAGTGIKLIKIGRKVKYRKSDVLDWLNQFQPQQSTSETKDVAA